MRFSECLIVALALSANVAAAATVRLDSIPIVRLLEAQGEFALALRAFDAGQSPPANEAEARQIATTQIRLQLVQGRTDEALSTLQQHAGCLEPGIESLLGATLRLRRGDARGALEELRETAPPEGLEAYAGYLEAEAALRLRLWAPARDAALRISGATLPAEMHQRLQVVRGRAALGLGDVAALHALAPALGAAARDDDDTGLLLLDLALASAALGETEAAHAWLVDLLEARPTPAESAYAALQAFPGLGRQHSTPESSLRLSRFEMRTDRHARARERLRARLGVTHDAGEAADIRLALAESYFRSGEFQRTLQQLQHASGARGAVAVEVVRLRARTLRRMGRGQAARDAYRELAKRFPSHALADDALYEVGWILENGGQLKSAERAYVHCARTYSRGSLADDAWMRAGLCALRDQRPAEALVHLQRVTASYGDSPLADNVLYWQMLAQQARRNGAAALALRDRLETQFPRSYFTVLARQRIESSLVPRLTTEPRQDLEERENESALARAARCHATYVDAIDRLRQSAGWRVPADFASETQLWRFFLDHGLAIEANWEAKRLSSHYDREPGALLELLAESYARGAHGRLVRLAYRLGLTLRDPAWRQTLDVLSYPAPYAVSLSESSARYGVSPALVLGLMRQESAFDARIDSRAGARGLMQIMPHVGRRVAAGQGIDNLHPDRLYDVATNIGLGCDLLASELRTARGNVLQALAAYNAGADRAATWVERLRANEPPELYIDLAEFYETRTYLETVLGNAEWYRGRYGLP